MHACIFLCMHACTLFMHEISCSSCMHPLHTCMHPLHACMKHACKSANLHACIMHACLMHDSCMHCMHDACMQCMHAQFRRGDNKLRQFYFKLLHRILVTNKELKYFGITNATKCAMCDEFDSIEHAFLECQSLKKLCRIPSMVQ